MMFFRVAFLVAMTPVWAHAANDMTPSSGTDPSYSFDDFVKKYRKTYATEEERAMREQIFDGNLERIQSHNVKNDIKAGGGHFLSVNKYADRRIPEELPLGLRKKVVVDEDVSSSNLIMATQPISKKQSTDAAEAFYQDWLQNTVKPVSELPKEVDWRTHHPTITTKVKDQGFCGSCWAVASTAVLESHIALKTGKLYTLSPQELVSCVKNPQHCGGGGGCKGATYELAFDYVQEHGMVTEEEFPYKSKAGANVQCSLVNGTASLLRGSIITEEEDFIDGAVASIQGYINFPNNNYTALMNAVATLGPIGVTVAASSWAFYGGGIYETKNHNSSDATGVDHAVVLEGYGVDQETQEPYWLVRNSWGPVWGEGGYIRLKRVDPSTLDDFDKDDCGMDLDPADGAACTKDKNGHSIVPKPVKVCGTSAILYDTFVPVGGHLISKKTSNVVVS